jgi:hypothetical protein
MPAMKFSNVFFFWGSVTVSALATTQPQPNQPRMTSVDFKDHINLCKSQGDVLGIVQCHHSDLGEVLTLRTWNCWNRSTDPTRKSQSEIHGNPQEPA